MADNVALPFYSDLSSNGQADMDVHLESIANSLSSVKEESLRTSIKYSVFKRK